MNSINLIQNAFEEAAHVLREFSLNPVNIENINKCIHIFSHSLRSGGKILTCGNGGSHCDAMHFAEELTGRYKNDRRALAALALSTNPGHLTCVGNDYGFETIFSREVDAFGKKEDVLLAISTSGNSKNILLAVESAKKSGLKVIGLSGKDGGNLKNLADFCLVVPSTSTERIQEVHIKIIHLFIQGIEKELGFT